MSSSSLQLYYTTAMPSIHGNTHRTQSSIAIALVVLISKHICAFQNNHDFFRHSPTSSDLQCPSSSSLFYQILGGITAENEEGELGKQKRVEYLRHLGMSLELDQQKREKDGSVSQAGTAWEASKVLADFITNPNSGMEWQDKIVLELGSGLGTCSLAAALMGARVVATDASATSLALLQKNGEKYAPVCRYPLTVAPLLWGDQATMDEFRDFEIDAIIASDVVFF